MLKHGMRALFACALIACATGAVMPGGAAGASAAAKGSPAGGSTRTRAPSMRQFTGWVTAFDKTTLTVEKRGKQPRTMVFARDSEMRTTGDIETDARVTVYYHDDGGQLTAHRVVVKSATGRAAGSRARPATSGTSATRGGR